MAYPIIVDTSSFQSDSLSFFNGLKSHDVSGAMVKLSEGVKYTSPKAANQIANAYKAYGVVGVYHFWHYGTNEAQYFLDKVKKMGLDKTTWLALDVEAPDLPQKCTAGINKFLGYLYANGYHNLMVYGSASWFKEGRIKQANLHKYAKLWVAAYGTSQPGINHVDIWQYTDRFKGMSLDASYDFKNLLKSNGKSDTPIKTSYYASKGLFEVKADMVHAYNKLPLKGNKNKRYVRLAKGSRFYGVAVKDGDIYSLKTQIGYLTANKDYVDLIKAIK